MGGVFSRTIHLFSFKLDFLFNQPQYIWTSNIDAIKYLCIQEKYTQDDMKYLPSNPLILM